MIDYLFQLFSQYQDAAIIISICISILVAIIGVIPSFFITAANLLFFGFWEAVIISFLGEAIGAGIAFILYRKGFKKVTDSKLANYPKVQRLTNVQGKDAFFLVLGLRLIPFVPSGLITFAAAIGRVSWTVFIVASSLGKIPALILEAYSVHEVVKFGWQGKLILIVVAVAILTWSINKLSKRRQIP